MTIPAALAHVEYLGSGAVTFTFPFQIDTRGELEVRVDGDVLTETVHYSIPLASVGDPAGGTVTFFIPPPGNSVVSIRRVVDIEQLLDLIPNTALPAVALEDQLDEVVKQIQMLEEVDSRTPSLPVGTESILRYLEFPPPGANGLLGWNADGTALTLYPQGIQGITINPISGVGAGKNTVAVSMQPGTTQTSALIFPSSVLAIAVTVWIQTTVGSSQGLQAIGIGTPDHPDCWGVLRSLTAGTESTSGLFRDYDGQPMVDGGFVTLTAYGGTFDASGRVFITGHFLTFNPSHTEGLTFAPGDGGESVPLLQATETTLGSTRYATPAETIAGLLNTAATHPAGVKAAVDARLTGLTGTALKATRYNAAGTNIEPVTGLTTSAAGTGLGINTTPEGTNALHVAGNVLETQGIMTLRRDGAGQLRLDLIRYGGSLVRILGWVAGGTFALPTATPTNTQLISLEGLGHDGAAFATAIRTQIEMRTTEAWTPTAQGSYISLLTTLTGTLTSAIRFIIDGLGNIGLGTAAPTFPVHLVGRVGQGVPNTAPTDTNLANNQMSIWVNGSTLTFRVRDNAGVLKTATLALT